MKFPEAAQKMWSLLSLLTHHAPVCLEQRVKTKEAQIENFWTSADFGYVKKRLEELRYMCEPTSPVSKFSVRVFKLFVNGFGKIVTNLFAVVFQGVVIL